MIMTTIRSRLTAQGQISVPAEIRKLLGIGPGSVLEWDLSEARITVRKAGKFSSKDAHAVLFPDGIPKAKGKSNPADTKDAIRKSIRGRHARD